MANELGPPLPAGSDHERLDSWKAVAEHLGRSVRTVQRWEREEGLPVRRLQHAKQGSVFAVRSELDAWWASRQAQLNSSEIAAASAEPAVGGSAVRRRSPFGVAAVAAAGIVTVVLVAMQVRTMDPAVRTIAVLPMANLTGDPGADYLADGLTESLIATLSKSRSFTVISRTSAMAYRGTTKVLPEIARELGADAVLETSLSRQGTTIRLVAQLIDGTTDRHIWSGSFDRDAGDWLYTQFEVARAVARSVGAAMPRDWVRGGVARQVSVEAQEHYLRGRYLWARRGAENLALARAHFEAAIALEPEFAPAYAGLADTWAVSPIFEPACRVLDCVPPAKAALAKALALDPDLAEARATLGYLLATFDWDWTGAERAFREAIALDPSYMPAHLWYGTTILRAQERHEEAIAELERAVRVDPLSAIAHAQLCYVLIGARRLDEAQRQLDRARALDATIPHIAGHQMNIETLRGNLPAAGEAYRVILKRERWDERLIDEVVSISVLGDTPEYWRRRADLLDRMTAGTPQGQLASRMAAHAKAGQPDTAFALADLAIRERRQFMTQIRVSSLLEPVRDDPRYRRLLVTLGLVGHAPVRRDAANQP